MACRTPDADLSLAAVFAHPGHELFVLGWMDRYRPRTSIWTDGSGRAQEPRSEHAAERLTARGVPLGALCGELSDRGLYRRILDGDDVLVTTAEKLEPELAAAGLDAVLGDPWEGHYLTHDLCRMVVGAVAFRVGRSRGRALPVWVYGEPAAGPERVGARLGPGLALEHPDPAAKLAEARRVPSAAFRAEVDALVARDGLDAHRHERFFEVDPLAPFSDRGDGPIGWEAHGLALARSGVYDEAVRFGEHVAPLARRLLDWARSGPAR